MAISETGSIESEKLAISQINEAGGILGRKIKIIQEDGASDWPTFAEKAKKLLVNDKVAAIMGCWTSASRKAVLPVLEQYNGMLYYPTLLRGSRAVQERHLHRPGSYPADPRRPELDQQGARRQVVLLHRFGLHLAPHLEQDRPQARRAASYGLQGRRRRILPARQHPVQLGHQQDQADQAGRDLRRRRRRLQRGVLQAAQGGRYRSVQAVAVDDLRDRDEIDGIGGENIAGAYACMKYFQSLDNPNNKLFVPAFKKMWGEKTVIGDVTQAAYLGPWLWKLTARRPAASTSTRSRRPRRESNSRVRRKVTCGSMKTTICGRRPGSVAPSLDGQFELVFETKDLVEPDPFPKGYQ